MMIKKELICINCPIGCHIEVLMDGNIVKSIKGFQCKRGEIYAETECTNPVRMVTSTAAVVNGRLAVAPVKTDKPIPKHLMKACIEEINKCTMKAPVAIGDIVLKNVLNTGVNIVATGNVPIASSFE